MKKVLFTAALLAGLSTTASLYAQGTILLDNGPGGLIYLDSVAPANLLVVDVNAQLFGGPVGGALTSLKTLAQASAAGITVDAGRISDPSGSPVAVPGVALGGTAELRLLLWQGSSPTFAGAAGQRTADSGLFSNPTGGNGSPPALPASLSGLPVMVLQVPEPSTLALAGLGVAALLAYRRRNN